MLTSRSRYPRTHLALLKSALKHMSAIRRDTFIGKRISLTRQAPLGATYEAKPIFNAAPSGASVVLSFGSINRSRLAAAPYLGQRTRSYL